MGKASAFTKYTRDIDKNTVKVIDKILIVCEGEKTEPNYFKNFPVYTTKIKVVGIGENTVSLVNYAINNKDKYDKVWCVFDKDSFLDKQFNEACQLAENNDIKLAYSVESFELWYLLHFNYLDTGISRKHYIDKLNTLFEKNYGIRYKKNSQEIYNLLKPSQKTALKHAKKLLSKYDKSIPPAKRYPVTYVCELVEYLNKLSIENRWQ